MGILRAEDRNFIEKIGSAVRRCPIAKTPKTCILGTRQHLSSLVCKGSRSFGMEFLLDFWDPGRARMFCSKLGLLKFGTLNPFCSKRCLNSTLCRLKRGRVGCHHRSCFWRKFSTDAFSQAWTVVYLSVMDSGGLEGGIIRTTA